MSDDNLTFKSLKAAMALVPKLDDIRFGVRVLTDLRFLGIEETSKPLFFGIPVTVDPYMADGWIRFENHTTRKVSLFNLATKRGFEIEMPGSGGPCL